MTNSVVEQGASSTSQAALALLEQHKKRIEQLAARQTRIQVQLETARAQYAQAVEQAQAAYGTADLDALRNLLAQKVKANNEAVQAFVQAVEEFDAHLSRIEAALADPVALEALLQAMPEAQDEDSPVAVQESQSEAAPAQAVEFDEEDI